MGTLASHVSDSEKPVVSAPRAPVKEGHLLAVAAMSEPPFRDIVELFDGREQLGGSYFRVVEKGFQPIDLDALSNKPLVGIGDPFPPSATAEQLAPLLDRRIETLLEKRRRAGRSAERQLEAKVIRSALCSGLRLIGFPATLRLVACQWQAAVEGRARLLDAIAADTATGGLVVIEVKPKFDPKAAAVVSQSVAHVREHAEAYSPFFSAMATAMADLYACPDMPAALDASIVSGLVAWPSDTALRFATCE
jgi:hypothetical protein